MEAIRRAPQRLPIWRACSSAKFSSWTVNARPSVFADPASNRRSSGVRDGLVPPLVHANGPPQVLPGEDVVEALPDRLLRAIDDDGAHYIAFGARRRRVRDRIVFGYR